MSSPVGCPANGPSSRSHSSDNSRSSSCPRAASSASTFSSSRLRAQAERQAAAAADPSLTASSTAATASRSSASNSGSSAKNSHHKVSNTFLALGGPGCRGRRGGLWCYICRDSMTRNEDNAVECTACPKRFHLECLQHEGVIQAGERVSLDEWLCPQCLEEHEEDEIQNDERCFICKRKEPEDGEEDRLLMCDGCPNSYHMRACLKLTIEPDEEKWFCPECNPSGFKRDEIRRLGRGRAQPGVGPGGEEIVNSSTCYVCQRPGKLLGCDFCVNSFHPTCLVDVDWDAIGDEWECPVCKGRDPLANQMHKRWSRAEIEAKRKERSKCLDRIRLKTTRYRNRFLLVHQKELGPFVNPKILAYLAKSLRGQVSQGGPSTGKRRQEKGGGRLQVERSMQDLLESLEDEALEESEKFVKRAYKMVRHPSGRKIEGVPLREGIELKPHQVEGVEWLLRSFMTGGGILADEMGLGKTIQTLCFLSYLNAMKLEGPHLIVVPLSTVGNWMREVHRFTPSLTHIKICGSRAERQHAMEDRLAQKGLYDLYITTYETVKSEEEFFVETIPHWQCIVLDEAHRIKNASGAVRHALDRVVGNMRLLLTGTPLQNNAAELFTLINFLMPDVFRDSQFLEQAFVANPQQPHTHSATPGRSSSAASKSSGGARAGGAGSGGSSGRGTPVIEVDKLFRQEDLEAIRNLLDRVMLRRLKEQAIALPKKSFHSVWLPLSGPAAQWYARLLKIRALQEAGKDKLSDSSYRKMLGLVIKMRIICAHPKAICARESQIQKLQAFFMDEETEMQSEVLKAARDTQQIEGEEHIVWSAKLSFLDKLMCHLHSLNCKYVPGYEKEYEDHRRESATYRFYKHHEELCKEEVAAGRKAPRRPKRAELMGLEEFRCMLERGNPRLRTGAVRTADDPDFLEEGMYPAELQMPQILLEPASSSSSLTGDCRGDGAKAENGGEGVSAPQASPEKICKADAEGGKVREKSRNTDSDGMSLSNLSSCTGSAGRRRRVLDYDDDDAEEKEEAFPRSSIVSVTKKRGLVILDDDEDDVVRPGAPSGSSADSQVLQPSVGCGTRSTSASSASSSPATSPAGEDRRDGPKQEEGGGASEPSAEKPPGSASSGGGECMEGRGNEEQGLLLSGSHGPRKATSSEDDAYEGLSTACCTTGSPSSTREGGQWARCGSGDSGDCGGTSGPGTGDSVCAIKKERLAGGASSKAGQETKYGAAGEAPSVHLPKTEGKQEECGEASIPEEKGEKEGAAEKKEFVIDRSQPRLQRLLVFSQFQLVLDELETYCQFRGWKYLRLDGLTNKFVRELDIRDFNSDGSTYFIYLISTRAGGLGINLTAANHVVLYDHDWNPFIDLQAIDRAHRIGQQREVHVWSLVNEWTVEERMAFRREQKLRLDKLLVQHQQEEAMIDEDEEERQQSRSEKISTDEIRKLMLHGRTAIVEVAAKRSIDITGFSLEELASRQRLPLPETVLDSAAEDEGASITRLDAEEAEEEEDKDEANLVDIDEVMNEEAEEQQKEQSLEAADGEGDGVLSRGGSGSSASGLLTPPKEGDEVATNSEEREEDTERGGTQAAGLADEKTEMRSADVEEVEKQEGEESVGGGGAGPNGGPKAGKGDLEKELQNAGVLWRSGRERKKPTAVYVPQEFGQREERKKIKHEQKCFICGNGKDFEQTIVDADGKTTKIALGDLVTCSGCPRAYHRACEGLPKDIKRSWRCRWHECCICFRKTSQCGNMLIHCAKCPTSFCYDCFPPDYCRYNVGEEYYSQLRQRGMNVTPQNWILLLCSRCKAVEEQQTRRRLTKEEKEQEKQQQKELRQQQKELHFELEGPRKGKDASRRQLEGKQKAEEERQFFEAKQQIDLEDSRQEDELRQSYQRLFPAAFIDELNKRVTAARVAQKAHRCATSAGGGGSLQAQEAAAHGGAPGSSASGSSGGVNGGGNGSPTGIQDDQNVAPAGGGGSGAGGAAAGGHLNLGKKGQQAVQKRPVNQLANMKLPGAAVGLCENCHFPCHGVKDYPSPCCFPPEIQSKFFLRHPAAVTARANHSREGMGACSGTSPAGALVASPSQGSNRLSTATGIDDDCVSAASSSPENLQQDSAEQGGRGSADVGRGTGQQQQQEKADAGMGGGSGGGREGDKGGGGEVSQNSPHLPVGGALTGKGVLEFIASLAATAGLTPDVITSGVDASTASRIAAAGGGPEHVKFLHRQVCACCGDSRIGRKAHLRKHCPSLSEADKQEYMERREKARQLIQRLQQHPPIPDTSNVNGYAGASPQRLKWYYHQYQDQADRILEEAMISVGLEAAVAPRASGGKRTYTVSSIHGGNSVRPSPSQLLLQNDGNLTADPSCGRKRGADGTLVKRQSSQGGKRPGRSPKGGKDSASNSDVEVVSVVRVSHGKGVSAQSLAGNLGKANDGNGGRGGYSKLAATNPWTASNHSVAYGRLALLKAVSAAASGQVAQDNGGAATAASFVGAATGGGSGSRASVDVSGNLAGSAKRGLNENRMASTGGVTATAGSVTDSHPSGLPSAKRRKPASPSSIPGSSNAGEACSSGGSEGGGSSLLLGTPSATATLQNSAPVRQQKSIIDFFYARNSRGGTAPNAGGSAMAAFAALAVARQHAAGMGGSGAPRATGS